ncbi:MAG: ribbon-helix-helix domain-containing protein [Candidatus Micrarchaeia archaeon]
MKEETIIKRKYTTITIPLPLFEKLKAQIKNTGFSSVSDYVTFLLREFVADTKSGSAENASNSADNNANGVIKRLKSLGYM